MAAPLEIEKLESQYHGNPEGTAFAPLANAHRKLGDPERAIEILHAGLVHHPEYTPARIVLGRCNVDRGDAAAAEMEFIRVLELDEENVIALQALADIAERDSRYPDSEGWLNTLLSLDGGNEGAREQLARVVAAAGLPAVAPAEEAQPVEDLETGAPAADSSVDEVAAIPGLEPTEPFDVEPPVPAGEPEVIGDVELEAVELPADLEPLPGLDAPDLDEAQIIGGEVGSMEAESIADGGLETWDLESAEPAVEDLGVSAGEADVGSGESESIAGGGLETWDLEAAEPAVEDLGVSGGEADVGSGESESIASGGLETWDLEAAEPAVEDLGVSGGEADVGSGESESVAGGGLETWDLEAAESAVEDLGIIGGEAEDRELVGEDELPGDLGASVEDDAVAGSELAGTAWDEPSLEVEEEEGEQEGDETPAVLSELDFEEDLVIGLPAEEPEAVLPEGLAGSGIEAREPEPETVATETMAELYLSQGHRLEALGIYRLLLAEQPEDFRLREKVAALEEEGRRPAAARDGMPSDFAATSRGGQSVADFFRVLLASRPDSEPPHAIEPPPTEEGERIEGAEPREATSPSAGGSVGEPTRPAHDRLLLSSVFGEDTSPVPPAIRSSGGAGAGTSTGRFSFDAFFGGQRGESVQPPEASSGKTRVEEEDLDQFQAWLQSLKG